MNRFLRAVLAALAVLAGCSSGPQGELTGQTRQAMTNGTVDDTDLAVGLLFAHAPPGVQPSNTMTLAAGHSWVWESCTGNLITPDVVLTAGHCFDVGQGETDVNSNVRMDSFYVGQGVAIPNTDEDWDSATVNMTKYTVDAFVRPSDYAPSSTCPPSDLDIAVLHLSSPVTGVTPLGLATAPPPVGAMVQTIGFGRHPTSGDAGSDSGGASQACIQTCGTSCSCLQSTCNCQNLQNIGGGLCICLDGGTGGATSYDQMVRRAATVPIAEVLTNYLHQTDVSQSTDLGGDSGGAVIYNGVVVGTDDCGNGATLAQTDQYFVRIDVAHDWIATQIDTFDGDAGLAATDGGASGSSSGSSSSSGASSGSLSDAGSTSSSGSSSGGAASGSTSGGSTSSGSSSSGSTSSSTSGSGGFGSGDDGGGDSTTGGTGSAGGCIAAGAPGFPSWPASGLSALSLALGGAFARRSRRSARAQDASQQR
jgi:Trypsin